MWRVVRRDKGLAIERLAQRLFQPRQMIAML